MQRFLGQGVFVAIPESVYMVSHPSECRARIVGAIQNLPKTRFLITGGSGMLGHAFARQLRSNAPHCEVLVLGKEELDVARDEQVASFGNWVRGGWIIHCAALVSVEGCLERPELAHSAIVKGTRNIVRLAEKAGARIFYPQSFLIYDGLVNPIPEDQAPRPLSLYGQLKVEAENVVLESESWSLIVRMAGFFGGESRDKNFVGKLIPHLSQLVRRGESSFAAGDRVWQPTWTEDLALNSLGLIACGKRGTYQMACQGEASFHDVAQVIVEELGWGHLINVEKVPAGRVSRHELGVRPSQAILSCARIRGEALDMNRPWREALREYLSSSYFNQYRKIRGGGFEKSRSA